MRISWLSADEIAVAREALTGLAADEITGDYTVPAPGSPPRAPRPVRTGGRSYDDAFVHGVFVPPPLPAGRGVLDWDHITEHVARAERVSSVVRSAGLDAARARFGTSDVAIEAATLAAAAHEGEVLALDEVIRVLALPIDPYVFYAPFLELLISLGKDDLVRAVAVYESFVDAYAVALTDSLHGAARVAAARDGLADVYVSAGRIDDAEALFERRHEEDQNDVAVALSASRAYLAAGTVSHAVRWLGVAAARATGLGRTALATKLRQTQEAVTKRLGEPN